MEDHRDDELRTTLLKLEEQGWQALSHGVGADFYQDALAEDAVMVFPFGVLSRQQSIEAMRSAPPWAAFRIEEPRAVQLTEGSALLIYRATARRPGQEPYAAYMTTVYVKAAGAWQPILHQQTPTSGS